MPDSEAGHGTPERMLYPLVIFHGLLVEIVHVYPCIVDLLIFIVPIESGDFP